MGYKWWLHDNLKLFHLNLRNLYYLRDLRIIGKHYKRSLCSVVFKLWKKVLIPLPTSVFFITCGALLLWLWIAKGCTIRHSCVCARNVCTKWQVACYPLFYNSSNCQQKWSINYSLYDYKENLHRTFLASSVLVDIKGGSWRE